MAAIEFVVAFVDMLSMIGEVVSFDLKMAYRVISLFSTFKFVRPFVSSLLVFQPINWAFSLFPVLVRSISDPVSRYSLLFEQSCPPLVMQSYLIK